MDKYYQLLKPPESFSFASFQKLMAYREVLYALVIKDLKVMYVQTFLGYGWAVINAVLTMLVLVVVFGKIGKIETIATPFVLFVMAGTCGWNYISNVIGESGRSILASRNLISKVYFPRVILPLSKAIVGLVELFISLLCLLLMMAVMGHSMGWQVILVPVFLLLLVLAALSFGLWVSALSILYRDFFHIVPFVLRLGMFITPVAFPYDAIPEKFRALFYLNPLAAPIEGLRWSLLGGAISGQYFYLSLSICILFFISGIWYFNKVSHQFADTI